MAEEMSASLKLVPKGTLVGGVIFCDPRKRYSRSPGVWIWKVVPRVPLLASRLRVAVQDRG